MINLPESSVILRRFRWEIKCLSMYLFIIIWLFLFCSYFSLCLQRTPPYKSSFPSHGSRQYIRLIGQSLLQFFLIDHFFVWDYPVMYSPHYQSHWSIPNSKCFWNCPISQEFSDSKKFTFRIRNCWFIMRNEVAWILTSYDS